VRLNFKLLKMVLDCMNTPDIYQLADKIKGAIYGQAIGDALGLGTEFMDDSCMRLAYPNGFSHYDEIFQDDHRSRWKKGEWTDDTDMMLCIANAIIKDKGVNLTTIANNFKAWASGVPMGIGAQTYKVLMVGNYVEHPIEVSKLVWEMSGKKSAPNGGVMRTSVVGLLPKDIEQNAVDICQLTHYDPRCVGSCVIVSELIHSLVYGPTPLTYEQMIEIANKYDKRIVAFLDMSCNEDIGILELQDSKTMGYTLKTLGAALWAYWHAETFVEGLLTVVRAGGDADTNAAVACAILGAKFGFSSIPDEYVSGLVGKEQLDAVVDGIVALNGLNKK